MTKFTKIVYKNKFGEITFTTNIPPLFIYSGEGFDAIEGNITSEINPYSDGVQVMRQSLKERTLTLTCYYYIDNEYERQNIINMLYKIFNPKIKGNLYLYTKNNQRKAKDVIVIKGPVYERNIESEKLDKLVKFQISFLKPSPYFEDIEENKIIYGYKDNLFEFIEEIDYENKLIYANEHNNVINNIKIMGDSESPIKIVFKAYGKVKNPYIINIYTREFIKINRTMKAGEIITITTELGNKRVESEFNKEIKNIFNDLDIDSTFMHLGLGDNWIRAGSDEYENLLETEIYYTNYWNGV